jgi:hypothetical protein
MELLSAIRVASELTRQLFEELETGDQEVWDEILDRRAAAMDVLDAAHRQASEQERAQHHDQLRQLRHDDDLLRKKSEYVLGMLALEVRESMGMASYAGQAAGGIGMQACLDKKA